jgi:hypothetical protein
VTDLATRNGDAPADPEHGRRRPVAVWLLSIYFGANSTLGLISLCLVYFGKLELPENNNSYVAGVGPIDLGLSIFVNLSMLVFAVTFFRLRAAAVKVVTALLFANLLALAYGIIGRDILTKLGVSGVAYPVIASAVMLLTLVYSIRLRRRGLLV